MPPTIAIHSPRIGGAAVSIPDAVSWRRARAGRIARRSLYVALAAVPLLVLLYFFVDRPLSEAFRGWRDFPGYQFVRFIQQFGEGKWYIVPGLVAALVLYLARSAYWRPPLYVALAVALSGIAVNVLKVIFGRYRPSRFFDDGDYGFAFFELASNARSFPSGHSTTVFAAAMALALLMPRLRIVWFTLAATLAFTRVVTGAHYLSDVIAGAWMGTVSALLLAVYLFPPPSAGPSDQDAKRSRNESRPLDVSSTTSAPPG